MSRLTRRRTRFRVGSNVVAETDDAIVLRLDESPVGHDARTLTVLLHPELSPAMAAAEMRLLARQIEKVLAAGEIA